ncbi:hypothetical protein J1605_005004 [Eschrichtius robustus]|uniref:Uncharacterized protein n=1 Tax=Eschrichtius robustus TaxID=9764 RepID=A0AB34HDJ8_ESCRO|nr:hypothetical protein J1605_005004 [Eschrichtius robustus]
MSRKQLGLNSSTKVEFRVLQEIGKERKLQGLLMEREKEIRGEGRWDADASQCPDNQGPGTRSKEDPGAVLASPGTHHHLRISAQGNRYGCDRKVNHQHQRRVTLATELHLLPYFA